ncbi:binary cytotoxin component [Pseudomonas syringae CC1557]|uniref:Binary cytotoxin component n=1 Tax=Pseudomonas syringae CC1557 TaxID=1357279 RepID=W0MRJ6_PSESX|nr:alpha-xenorhabdolysin family binary toxin subunit A [Pseudomonas syringae]AHG39673.1 binary cytotoxin component [Pseudomonas syringae CC1557]
MINPVKTFITEDLARVTTKPVEYLRVTLEDEKNEGRSPGLILTKEDVLSLKRYERQGLNLPTTLALTEQYLGFKKSGIPGLEPKDVMDTYITINRHARSWSPIENAIKTNGFDIGIFADHFVRQGGLIITHIERMDIIEQLTLTIADLKLEDISGLKSLPLSSTEKQVCGALSSLLTQMAGRIDMHRHSAELLTEEINTFSNTLNTEIMPSIQHKVTLSSNSELDQEIRDLESDIDQLTRDIEQKAKEYTKAKNSIAWGGFGGPIGVAITGGIFGSQAERIRKDKNRLIHIKTAKVQQLKEKRPLAAAILSLQLMSEDMNLRMQDAQQGATNLKDVWALLSSYIKSSAQELATIEDDHALFIFAFHFQGVISPWLEIRNISTELLNIFERALDQFKSGKDITQ